MVITVTFNPAMDKTLTIDDFKLGTVNRVNTLRYDIGGKGINVSKVLKNIGIDSVCTGFLGGIWENRFNEELSHRGIKAEFINIKGNTRTNTKVVDTANSVYTDINEAGPDITDEELKSFINYYENTCSEGDIVVLSGGVSPSIPKDIYAVLTKIAKNKGAFVILDADGELLKEGLKEKPDIIKPNEHELAKLIDIDVENMDDIIKAAQLLRSQGVRRVLVSMGGKGALYVTENGVSFAEGLKVPVKSTVGAGDSMVAALAYSIINKYDDLETLKFANACGAASVTTEGTEACSFERIKEMLAKVKVKKVEEI